MEIKNNVLEMNEEIKNEMEKILWTQEEMVESDISEVQLSESRVKENEIDINIKEEEKQPESVPEVKEQPNEKVSKPRTNKNGNWFDSIPDEDKLQPGDIVCLKADGLNKFGEFIKYGKRNGIYWVNMRKKNSREFMSREWSVKDVDCDIVYHNGVLNDNYTVDDNGIYYVK